MLGILSGAGSLDPWVPGEEGQWESVQRRIHWAGIERL